MTEDVTDIEEANQEAGAEKSDIFQTIIAIMIAVVSVTGAVVAWQTTLAEPDKADQAGLRATLNMETTRFINTAALYKNYQAYTTYALNDELQRQIEVDLAKSPPLEQPILEHQQEQAAALVAISQRFFAQRYLNRDGSYNIQRQLGEAWAQAGQNLDLDTQTHFDQADKERTKTTWITGMIIGLTISLLFYTFAESLHPARKSLRYVTAIGGTLFLAGSVTGLIVIESLL